MFINEAGYILSCHEMMLLAAAVGGGTFMGFSYGEDIDTREKAEFLWQNVKPSLQKKNFIYDGDAGFVTIDRHITDCMEVCVNPEYFVSCRIRAEDEETACCYYAAEGRFVKLERYAAGYILTPIKSQARLNISIQDAMGLERPYPAPDAATELALSPEHLNMIIKSGNNRLDHMDFIKRVNLTDAFLADMANAVRNPEMRTLLLLRMNEQQQEDLFVYAGKYLWRLTRDDSDGEVMKLSMITSEEYLNELTRILGLINTQRAAPV